MTFGTFILFLCIAQILLLLLSPFFKNTYLRHYYKHVYHPIFQDNTRFKAKFYAVPVFYISLFGYLVFNFYSRVEPYIHENLSSFEKFFFLPIAIFTTPIFGILTMFKKPHSSLNPGLSKLYPFDNLLFYPNTPCRTCKREKPARSKHCSICNACVLLCDHHCVWVYNCIGSGNYRYFYLFLMDNTLFMAYASIRLLQITFSFRGKGDPVPRDVISLDILCWSFLLIVGVFTYMQLRIISDGMTGNEKDKWFTIQALAEEEKLVRSIDGKWYIKFMEGNVARFYSTNPYDEKVYNITEYEYIRTPEEIPNIYDKESMWENIKDVCEL